MRSSHCHTGHRDSKRPYPHRMATVGSDAQPAIGREPATVPETRDEKALPRSEPGIKQINPDYGDITKLDESLYLNETNWVVWRGLITRIFQLCGVEAYVKGILPCPDPNVDPEGAENWSCNDVLSQIIISFNVTQSQRWNILMCTTAHEMWKNLEIANSSQESKALLARRRRLCHTTAGEGDNIIEHLEKLKKYRMNLTALGYTGKRLQICDSSFNEVIAESLPPSWDYFTGPYIRTWTFLDGDNPKTTISSQRFIELIEQEYRRRELRDRELLRRRSMHITTMYCKLCNKRNHNTDSCRFLGQPRCHGCGRFGHVTSDCQNNKGKKRKYEED